MKQKMQSGMKRLHMLFPRKIKFNLAILLAVFFIILLIVLPEFRRLSNIRNILTQSAVLASMALGQTFVILLGGIDLSVGAVGAFSGALAAGFITSNGLAPFFAVLLALIVGAGIGFLNGALIYTCKIPPFVATLSTMVIARGATLVYTQGAPISVIHPDFVAIANPRSGGIAFSVLFVLLLFCIGFFVLRYSVYGLNLYATGGDARMARLSRVPVAPITFSAYTICGFCAACGGIILTSRLWSAQPTALAGIELEAIAATVLGGASLFGGVGTVQGTLVGTLMLGVLSNGMNLMLIPSYVQRVIRGAVLIIAVAIDVKIKNKERILK